MMFLRCVTNSWDDVLKSGMTSPFSVNLSLVDKETGNLQNCTRIRYYMPLSPALMLMVAHMILYCNCYITNTLVFFSLGFLFFANPFQLRPQVTMPELILYVYFTFPSSWNRELRDTLHNENCIINTTEIRPMQRDLNKLR